MSATETALSARTSWYAAGVRRLGQLLAAAAEYLDRRVPRDGPLEPMPRHTSFDEVLGDLRNRIQSGFGGGHRPYY